MGKRNGVLAVPLLIGAMVFGLYAEGVPFVAEELAGTWYEVARLPNRYEKGLVDVTSTISFGRDGEVEMTNKGYKGVGGKSKVLKGKGYVPDRNDPTVLKMKFLKIFSVDYKILEYDKDLQHILVSGDSKDFLWILSRSPALDEKVYNHFREAARKLGYNVARMYKVNQITNNTLVKR